MDAQSIYQRVEKVCADCPEGYVRVARMNGHRGLPHTSHPDYGRFMWSSLPSPWQDRPAPHGCGRRFREVEHWSWRCAATPEQFPRWWPEKTILRALFEHHYAVAIYEVPEDRVLVMQAQVVFDNGYERCIELIDSRCWAERTEDHKGVHYRINV